MPRLCETTTNNSVINVIESTATADFCVMSRDSIVNIAVNDNYTLFNNISSDSSLYKLSTETGNSSIHYTLQVFNVTRESPLNYYVVLETEFNLTLRYNFNVTFLEDHPKLCNETKNDTAIEAVGGKLTAHFCLVTKENITTIRVNEQSIFDEVLLPLPRYSLTNQTHHHFKNFTLEIHNVTDVVTHSYKVKILTKSRLELQYAFHVSLGKHVPKNCSSTQNSSNLVFLDNIATISLCVNKRTSISEINFENVTGVKYDTSEIVQYTNTTIHLHEGIQYSIKLFNITRNVPFGIRVKLLEESGNMSTYIFYRHFPNENKQTTNAEEMQHLTYVVPITTVFLIVIMVLIGFFVFSKRKDLKRKDSFLKTHDEFVYEGLHKELKQYLSMRQDKQNSTIQSKDSSSEDIEEDDEHTALHSMFEFQPRSVYEHVL
ncbi:unnamed protein product [Lymnaea stagnalis]|uniref:Uncharacterized protein n=1 Tax=Lymnaea stagnalis TaxID=6523 RepID=A0AAV2IFQ6_LYMST